MTAKYTDKSDLAPDNYLTSVIYDFSVMPVSYTHLTLPTN